MGADTQVIMVKSILSANVDLQMDKMVIMEQSGMFVASKRRKQAGQHDKEEHGGWTAILMPLVADKGNAAAVVTKK